ncbi:MAG: PD-(D/E)XK nuclease family protein [Deltaproteobacteria bacterium]
MSSLILVPTALRKSRAERRLCDAQEGLLLGPRVSTLAHLVPGLLAGAGERRALLTPLAERLLSLDAVREAGLLGEAGATGGAARAAAHLLSELRSAEVTPAELRGAAAGAPRRVAERLEAAAGALSAYEARLEGCQALDSAGALRCAATAAERGSRSEETADLELLVLEGLLPSSRAALDLGTALTTRARHVVARIPFLPEEAARASPAEPWLRRIESLHELAARRDVEVSFPRDGIPPGRRVVRVPAQDDVSQCDAAARLSASLLDDGFAAAEVAVIAPRRLLELLPAAFARLGVPLAVALSRPLASIPLVRDIRAALGAASGLDRTGLLALLGSPYLGPEEPLPGLRFHLDRAGVLDGRGDPEERLRARAAALTGEERAGRERSGLLRAAGAARAFDRALAMLRSPATPAAWAARIRSFLEGSGVRRSAAQGDPAVARRDLAAVARLEELVDELAAALRLAGSGSERLSREAWTGLLDVALSRVELPVGQGPAAGAVEAWPVEEAPGLASRATLVLGAERGSWPGESGADPILGNAGRELLQAHLGRRALATGYHRRAEAEFRGLWALCSASEMLAVGWTRAEEEGPAPLAAQVLDMADAPELPLAADPPLGASRGEGEALRAAARLARDGEGDRAARALAPLPELAARAGEAGEVGRQERERRDAWATGRATQDAGQVPPGLPAWRDALPDEWSATELELAARCPFRFLLKKAGIREPRSGDLDMEPRDEGSLVHAVLESFVRERRDRGAWPPRDSEADREDARAVAVRVFARFEADGSVGDPATWAARREAVLRRVDRFVADEAGGDPGLRPVLLEWDFGGLSGRPPLVIPDPGGDVRVKGRIDRVDADADRLRVMDYKNSRSLSVRDRLDPAALGVTSFQAPLYLLAAQRELPGRTSLEASFVLLRSGERPSSWSTTPGDPALALDPEGRAAARAAGVVTVADGVVAAVARIRAGELPVASEDCTGCPFGAVCRFPRAGEA